MENGKKGTWLVPVTFHPPLAKRVAQQQCSWFHITRFVGTEARINADHGDERTSKRLLFSRRKLFANNFGKTVFRVVFIRGRVILCKCLCDVSRYFRMRTLPGDSGFAKCTDSSASVRKTIRIIRESRETEGNLFFFFLRIFVRVMTAAFIYVSVSKAYIHQSISN